VTVKRKEYPVAGFHVTNIQPNGNDASNTLIAHESRESWLIVKRPSNEKEVVVVDGGKFYTDQDLAGGRRRRF